MTNIKIKIKTEEPIDEILLKRKDFKSSFKKYETIKASYNKLAALWGASIGIAVFIGILGMDLLVQKKVSSYELRSLESSFPDDMLNTTTDSNSITDEPSRNSTFDTPQEEQSTEFPEIKKTTSIAKESNADKKPSKKEVIAITTSQQEESKKTTVKENTDSKKMQKGINIDYLPE